MRADIRGHRLRRTPPLLLLQPRQVSFDLREQLLMAWTIADLVSLPRAGPYSGTTVLSTIGFTGNSNSPPRGTATILVGVPYQVTTTACSLNVTYEGRS